MALNSIGCPAARPPPLSRRTGRTGRTPLKPWPGKSGTTRRACGASSGSRARNEWLAAPVPCSSHRTGRCASAGAVLPSITGTGQRWPPASTHRLAW